MEYSAFSRTTLSIFSSRNWSDSVLDLFEPIINSFIESFTFACSSLNDWVNAFIFKSKPSDLTSRFFRVIAEVLPFSPRNRSNYFISNTSFKSYYTLKLSSSVIATHFLRSKIPAFFSKSAYSPNTYSLNSPPSAFDCSFLIVYNCFSKSATLVCKSLIAFVSLEFPPIIILVDLLFSSGAFGRIMLVFVSATFLILDEFLTFVVLTYKSDSSYSFTSSNGFLLGVISTFL